MKKLSRYLERQRNLGRGVIPALARLPWEIARSYYRKIFPEKDCPKHGYRLYDKFLIASYPRSGTNWIRFIIEDISGLPTPGKECLHPQHDGNFAVDRAHKAFTCMGRHRGVLFVLRDYRECLLRQHRSLWIRNPVVAEFLVDRSEERPPCWYIKNIEAFEQCARDKLLVYYEDLVTRPQDVIPGVAQFLGLDPRRTAEFLDQIDQKYAQSVNIYKSGGRPSVSTTTRNLRHHADELLTPAQQLEFDAFYRERHPGLFGKYLERYGVSDAG